MVKFITFFFSIIILVLPIQGQVAQYPQVFNNGMDDPGTTTLYIHQLANSNTNNIITSLRINSKIGAVDMITNSSDQYFSNWVKVCLPSTDGSLKYGYIASNEFYARIDPSNYYAKVTATSLNIRPTAGSTSSNVLINGLTATFGQNSILALTGTESLVGSTTWYQVYLTLDCSQATGWVSGAFLVFNGAPTNYKIVAGRVCTSATNCNGIENIEGAAINFSNIGTAYTCDGFYQYKLPTNQSCSITCSYTGYNTTTPPSYQYTADIHRYNLHFLLGNTVSCLSPTSQSNNITFQNVASDKLTLNWNSGNGTKRIVVAKANSAITGVPANATTYTADATFGNGSVLNTGEFIVYNGTGSSVIVTNLLPFTTYYFRIYEYNCGSPQYLTTTATGNPNSQVTLPSGTAPTANFNVDAPIIVAGQTVHLTDASSSNTTSWGWKVERLLGTGSYVTTTTSTQKNLNITLFNSGCYRVTLTASNTYGSSTATSGSCIIYVKPNLAAPIPPDVARAQKYPVSHAGDPVNLATGNFDFSMRDITLNGINTKLSLERRYFSNADYEGPFGKGWFHTFDIKIDVSNASDWKVQYPDGHNEHYAPYSNGETQSMYKGNFDTLSFVTTGGTIASYTLNQKDGTKWNFNDAGLITSMADLNGNQTTFNYSGDKLLTVTAPGGRFFQFSYNTFAKVSSVSDNSGKTVRYYYDPTGHYLDSTRIGNSRTYFKYDSHGITEVYDPKGNRIIYNLYDAQGRVYKQYDADSNLTTFQYNTPIIGSTIVTDPLGYSKRAVHDENLRCIQNIDELRNTTKYGYSLNNTLDTITDPRGYVTTIVHDTKGNTLKTINANGYSDSVLYTSLSKPQLVQDKEGNKTLYIYDAAGNLIQIILPTNDTIKHFYNANGLDTLTIDLRGFKTRRIYNSFGEIIQLITPTSSTRYSYDAVGRLVETTDSYGKIDSFYYNYFDQVVRHKDPMGYSELFEYDQNGNQIISIGKKGDFDRTETYYNKFDHPYKVIKAGMLYSQTEYDLNQRILNTRDAEQHVRIYNRDEVGRVKWIADSLYSTSNYFYYDAAGNISSFTDGLNVYFNRIDDINRITSTKNPLDDSIQYRYDKNDKKVEEIDEEGRSTKWQYDVLGRHIKTIDAANNSVQLYYNKTGQVDSVKDARGYIRFKNTIDGSGRVTTSDDGQGHLVNYWDSTDVITKVIDPDNRTISYTYDANKELTDITVAGTTIRHFSRNASGEYTKANSLVSMDTVSRDLRGWITNKVDGFGNNVQYSYYKNGTVKSIVYPGGKTVEYIYNTYDKCVQVKDWNNKIYTVNRYRDGRISRIVYPNGFKTVTEEDELSRTKSWINTNDTGAIFQSNLLRFSKTGNVLNDSGIHVLPFIPISNSTGQRIFTIDDELTDGGDSTMFAYTKSGQRSEYKRQSNTLYTYKWSPLGELDSTTDGGTPKTFKNDALGGRIGSKSAVNEKRYVADHKLADFPIVLQERNTANQELINYLYIPGDGILLGRDSAGMFRYFHHTLNGNVAALSDNSGKITDRYEYSILTDTFYHAGPSTQPFTWMGMYGIQHEGNNLYYVHARYYDGKTGTFLSKDVNKVNYLNTQDLDRYTYGYNNRLRFIDPLGLSSHDNISYENQDWVLNGLIDASQKIKDGKWVGTGYAQEAVDYYQNLYNQSIIKGKPNNWYLVGLSAASLWTPENYQTTLTAFTLSADFSGSEATKYFGKTDGIGLWDMRTVAGQTFKKNLGAYNALSTVNDIYENLFKKRENFTW